MNSSPLRIGIVCYPSFGGSGAVATELGRLLARRGHTVHFISYARPFRLATDFHENIFHHEISSEHYPLFQGQLYTIAAAVKMYDIIRNTGLDLLHLHYALPHAVSAHLAMEMLAPEERIPFVTTLHGTDITLVGSKPSFYPAVKLGLDKSNALTCVSRWLDLKTCEIYNLCERTRVIYNFVDPEMFKPSTRVVHRKHYAAPDEKIVMHISNFRPVKRVEDVVRAFSILASQVPARLLMVGDGPERETAGLLAERLGIEDRVRFLGNQPSVECLLPLADAFLFPSDGESFGLAALEAMACGVPVVGARAGGLPEVVIHNETGRLHDVGDIEGMGHSLIELCTTPDLRAAMSEGARRRAVEEFAADKIIPQYEALYREVLGGVPAGAR